MKRFLYIIFIGLYVGVLFIVLSPALALASSTILNNDYIELLTGGDCGMNDIYFVLKTAVYDHGVFFVSENLSEAIGKCNFYAENDVDGHHAWQVLKYKEAANSMKPINEVVYETYGQYRQRDE